MKRLSRADLLEMLIDQSKEYQKLKKRLKIAEAALQEREIAIEQAGSIAEAALSVNGIFEAAQASCEQYMDNIRTRSERQDTICRQREKESIEKAQQLIEDTMRRCEDMEQAAAERCAAMVMEAKAQAEAYWAAIEQKLEERYAENAGYSELLTLALVQKELKGKHEAQSRRRKKGWSWPSRNRRSDG